MKVDLKISTGPQDYLGSLKDMEARVYDIQNKKTPTLLWFLEYPPLFTEGRNSGSNIKSDYMKDIPTWVAPRGGKTTYHGPGQRVVYVLLNLENHGKDIKKFVFFLEEWILEALSLLGVKGKRCQDRTGVWVDTPQGEKKIAALGVRLQKWVTSHGFSLNVHPDLGAYSKIVPCGLENYGVTSLHELGVLVPMEDVDQILLETFPKVFQDVLKGNIDGYY